MCTTVADTMVGFHYWTSRSPVSDESIPERGGRKNVSELARSYHVATRWYTCAWIAQQKRQFCEQASEEAYMPSRKGTCFFWQSVARREVASHEPSGASGGSYDQQMLPLLFRLRP